jgi:hypothetical protein
MLPQIPIFPISGRPDFRGAILRMTLPFEVIDVNKLIHILATPEIGITEQHCLDVGHAIRLLLESGDLYRDHQQRLLRVRKSV